MNRLTKEQADRADYAAHRDAGEGRLTELHLDHDAGALSRARILDLLALRDTLLDILERLHSVQNGCPLHKYEADWNKAMEDAEAAFTRAGGGA